MSSDNGYILRINSKGRYVLQHYFASYGYPDVEDSGASQYDTLEDAIASYEFLNRDYPCEYGLTTIVTPEQRLLHEIFSKPQSEESVMETVKYVRKTFYVDAVQVTAENMEDVAKWCQGEVREEEVTPNAANPNGKRPYIHVRVHRPLNERQTQAFVGDWVLYAGTGYKVYTTKAFSSSFDLVGEDKPVELAVDRNVFEDNQNVKVN